MSFFQDIFPGNKAVEDKLCAAMDDKNVIAFTGAGTSMPSLPSWRRLLTDLIQAAFDSEAINEGMKNSLYSSLDDPLFVADSLSQAFGEHQFRNRIAKLFGDLKQPTDAHKAISNISFKRLMTLNYDVGLEMAHSLVIGEHLSSVTPIQRNELQGWMTDEYTSARRGVLHWHGIHSYSEELVLTGDDYNKFYEQNIDNKERFRSLIRTERLFAIGFGFSDPFINSQLEAIMRPLPTDNVHFAAIGVFEDRKICTQTERLKYAKKYKLEVIFYPVIKKEDGTHDHSSLLDILNELQRLYPYSEKKSLVSEPIEASSSPVSSYKDDLFSVGNRQIYCEPNISVDSRLLETDEHEHNSINLKDISIGNKHACISAPHEYGLTTIGKKITSDIKRSGGNAVFRVASSLPNYKKKLLQDDELKKFGDGKNFTIVLDEFSVLENIRLLREIISTFEGSRVIVLRRSDHEIGDVKDELLDLGFDFFSLNGLSRKNVRNVVECFLPVDGNDHVSSVVEKVYTDLLQLCIPLTPSNVVMYCSVLCRDGDFSPISRLQIMEKFISNALGRASDAYSDSFNANHKTNLFSEFCFYLFRNERVDFTVNDWNVFCEKYKENNLVNFSSSEVLGDLIHGRILCKFGRNIYFKYRMFFVYFIGKYISQRPDEILACIASDEHMKLEGLVEVLCGLSTDSGPILSDLTEKLEKSLSDFYENYPIKGVDLHNGVEWKKNDKEEFIWKSIDEAIDQGPANNREIDELKTSISAEMRTEDQKISIIKFIVSERTVSQTSFLVRSALENSVQANAATKKRAAEAVLAHYGLAYEVASIFAPMIAKRKYFSWNGFTYINLIERNANCTDENEQDEQMLCDVLFSLPGAVKKTAGNQFSSRKLGEVFSALVKSESMSPFKKYLLFSLVIRSKPEQWREVALEIIGSTRSCDVYLLHMLNSAVAQYKVELNTSNERQMLKEVVTSVKLRRDTNAKLPSRSMVEKGIDRLEDHGFWKNIDASA